MSNVLIALAVIERLARLVRDAQEAGQDISDTEMKAAFARADAAEQSWEEAGEDNEQHEQGD